MKKLFKTTVMVLIFSALSFKAGAVVLDSNFLKEKIKKEVEEQLKSKTNGTIKVEEVNLPYEKIDISEIKNEKLHIETKINNNFLSPLTMVRVSILVNNTEYKAFMSQVKIKIYEKVWVAEDYIQRGELLTNVNLEEKDVTYLPKQTLGKEIDLYKYVSKKNYKPGDIINSNFVEKSPVIVKDSPVSVVFKTSSVSVTIPAVALDKGGMGDYIKVRSKNYRKDYLGKIIGENTVLVSI